MQKKPTNIFLAKSIQSIANIVKNIGKKDRNYYLCDLLTLLYILHLYTLRKRTSTLDEWHLQCTKNTWSKEMF